MAIDTVCLVCSKHWVNVNNFIIHSGYCERNIISCILCGEGVARAEMEEHMAAGHKVVVCDFCCQSMESAHKEQHMVGEDNKALVYYSKS